MRPPSFDPSVLRRHLRRHKIADLPELKRVLGTQTDLTVFRKLQQLDYLASYTHRGRFYTLPEIAHFDDRGRWWSHQGVWFSRHGTLLATLETFVNRGGWPVSLYRHRVHPTPPTDAGPTQCSGRFPWPCMLLPSRLLPTNSRPPSFCSMACSMNNSGGCLLGWSPFAWAMAGTL
ncbi:MAG: hypothetical protein ABSF15_16210 [Candidatus Sulfotelmatobacter sp.]